MQHTLYLDMDGVLADFEKKATEIVGMRRADYVALHGTVPFWAQIDSYPDFYNTFDPMEDARDLWEATKHLNPTVLTGLPHGHWGGDQKRAWISRQFGADVPVICCRCKEKYLHCKPGDILIDDHTKYRHLWMRAGGRYIVHTDTRTSLLALEALGVLEAASSEDGFVDHDEHHMAVAAE